MKAYIKLYLLGNETHRNRTTYLDNVKGLDDFYEFFVTDFIRVFPYYAKLNDACLYKRWGLFQEQLDD